MPHSVQMDRTFPSRLRFGFIRMNAFLIVTSLLFCPSVRQRMIAGLEWDPCKMQFVRAIQSRRSREMVRFVQDDLLGTRCLCSSARDFPRLPLLGVGFL